MASRMPEAIGDYKILEEIGHGGMGTLYRARDPKIGREVAIKLLREGLDDKDMRERFAREARSAGRLKHGNIVTIFELGDHNDMPFIAMEFVQGETLASFLRRRPPVPLTRKLQIMDQVCAGLHYAHRMGVVHRDIKPANVMIDDEGTVKILDFGIARMGASKITLTGMVIGTLNYMAPEQMKGMSTDARADMFSIGAVFYELLSYRNAFAGDAPSTVMHKILYGRPEELEIVCPNLDPALVAIVSRCLEKQRENRYADLGVVRAALADVSRRIQAAGDAGGENDQTLPIVRPGIESPRGQTPGSGSRNDSAGMEQMLQRAEQTRAKQIQAHIDSGRRALDQGDFDAAFAACEQALVLDPTCRQALDLEARARATIDRQQAERLSAARAEIDRGALTAAGFLADQVLAVNAESKEAHAIHDEVEQARRRLAEELEREQERQRAFAQALGEAQRELASGSLDSAAQAVERALAVDPTRPEALSLKEKISAAVTAAREARRRAEEARARKAVEEAKRVFGTGDHATAFSILDGFAIGHPFVTAELEALKLEAREIERRRAEAAQKKAEADRQKLEAEAARLRSETDAARRKLEAEVERLKRESEAERLKFDAEAARLKSEAEAERQKRKAEAERLKREAENARRQREAEVERLNRQADPTLEHLPPGDRVPPFVTTPPTQVGGKPAAADSPRVYKPPPARSQPPPEAVSRGAGDGGSRAVALGAIAIVAVIVVALGIIIVMRWGAFSETASDSSVVSTSPLQPPPATPPVAIEPNPLPTTASVPGTPSAAQDTPSPDQVRAQRIAQARGFMERAEYDAAIAAADEVLVLDARNPDAIELRARAVTLKNAANAPARGGPGGQPKPNPVPRGVPAVANEAITPKPSVDPAASTRARELTDRYNQAREALEGGALSNAVGLLDELQRDESNYRDVPALLARAREGLGKLARQALDTGAKLESSGDLAGALQQYERGRQMDSSVDAVAESSINRVRARMKTEGAEAFGRGRQYDALDRVDQAIAQYERAVRYLQDDDPNRKIARERLEILRARK